MFQYDPPQAPWLEIIYQDNHLVVLNKQAGLLTVPGKAPEHADSLINRVLRVFPTARIIHRLDMATSGLILVAFDKPTQAGIGKQFEARRVHKEYEALISGKLTHTEGEITLPLRCDWPNRPKQMVDMKDGKSALTRYQVKAYQKGDTRVLLQPITGRSHQLRVHMLALGHPIVGDRLYGIEASPEARPRLHLHATRLVFKHPIENTTLDFKSPVPF